jgi:hypothetical protein
MAFQRLSALELETRTQAGGDLATDAWDAMTAGERFALALRWLAECLVGWSYPEPVSEETRVRLDAPTLIWAYIAAVKHNFLAETPEQKKSDSPSSTATSTATTAFPLPEPGSSA